MANAGFQLDYFEDYAISVLSGQASIEEPPIRLYLPTQFYSQVVALMNQQAQPSPNVKAIQARLTSHLCESISIVRINADHFDAFHWACSTSSELSHGCSLGRDADYCETVPSLNWAFSILEPAHYKRIEGIQEVQVPLQKPGSGSCFFASSSFIHQYSRHQPYQPVWSPNAPLVLRALFVQRMLLYHYYSQQASSKGEVSDSL